MATLLTPQARGLLTYLLSSRERANEDLALGYFRDLFGDDFQRQGDAGRADGYVAGSFVLELKTKQSDWLAGLIQGLAYQNCDLDFAQVVVAADRLLCVWRVADLPEDLRAHALNHPGPPHSTGTALARLFSDRALEIRNTALWDGKALFEPLFASDEELLTAKLEEFKQHLVEGEKQRIALRPTDIRSALREMKSFFDPDEPLKAVRAFYTMLYGWSRTSTVSLSRRANDSVTVGGESVTGLIPGRRIAFKDFVEARYVGTESLASIDEFFAAYDTAVDAVDPAYRRKHGMYFTDLGLSRFVMWIARDHIPEIGQNYLVIDPACGSGNLVTNWRSPLDIRHKVVSEIDPELLFAVEARLRGDDWHRGRFTVVPRVSEGRGLNFLDRSAEQYLAEITQALDEKGLSADKPLAFLCNPPYRSDDDQAAGAAEYTVHPTIAAMTGPDAESERYCCFLAQMKRVCEVAADSGLPGEALLLLFTKSAWLTRRSIFAPIRREMLSVFEDVDGVLVDGSEFFDVNGKWPVAFTIWRYRGDDAGLDAERSIPLRDLTQLKRRDLASIPWPDRAAADRACRDLQRRCQDVVRLGEARTGIREWAGQKMVDFKRDRRKAERGVVEGVGGLPKGDKRRGNKKIYGEANGPFVGFMDDLTPCRVSRGRAGRPWFRLNSQFMDAKKNRCFSGPPTHLGLCAEDLPTAKPLFFWYATARTFLQEPYPMWADAEDLWAPVIPKSLEARAFSAAMALAYAENECVETVYPAHNPVQGALEITVENPMSPISPFSFWSTTLRPYVEANCKGQAKSLVASVDELFRLWAQRFAHELEIEIDYARPYHVDVRPLGRGAGIAQIKDFADRSGDAELLQGLTRVRASLKAAKAEFSQLLTAQNQIGYFTDVDRSRQASASNGQPAASNAIVQLMPNGTEFQKALARRVAMASRIVSALQDDKQFGRTKLVKLFYLADQRTRLDLRTSWAREAAGPLDARALYHEDNGLEALAAQSGLFEAVTSRTKVRYRPLKRLEHAVPWIESQLGTAALRSVDELIELCRPLDTDQCEIVATLYACWNDLLIRRRPVDDRAIIKEFRSNWHVAKTRFAAGRLQAALEWMREKQLVPDGGGSVTRPRHSRAAEG